MNNKNMTIRGAGGAKAGKGKTPIEAPDTLRSTAYARILDLISEGEIVGLVNGLKSVFFEQTPLMNADNSFNFKNVQIDTRTGTQDQEHIANFPSVENEIAVNLTLRTDTVPVETTFVRTITNLALSAIRIRMSVLALTQVDSKTGNTNGYEVGYTIELATDGGALENVFAGSFKGKTSQPFERSHRIDLPVATVSGWLVKVRRTTPNTVSNLIQDTLEVVSFTEIIDVKLRMPNSALVGVVIDASQFQSIPVRGYHMKGRIIRVPSNYNAELRTYTGIWDGTFQTAYTNNPAWVFYDLVTHPVYGLGHKINDSQIDKWALYDIGRYADEMVDDGIGGVEPRFVANVYLQTAEEAYKVIQDLASIFRGISYWAGGAIVPVADKPEVPTYTYTNSNVDLGTFVYAGSSLKARHTVALVSWSDIKRFGAADVQYVSDDESIARYGIQPIEVTSIGGITQGMAERMGRWILLSEKLETNTVTFTTGIEGSVAAPGKLVRVLDHSRAGTRRSGRVKAATTSVITVDAIPNPLPAIGDTLTVILSNAVAATSTISNVSGNNITVGIPFANAPVPDSIWATESSAIEAQVFRVLEVQENELNRFVITALEHNASKFNAIDFGYQIQVPTVSLLPSKVLAPPSILLIDTYIKLAENQAINVVTASWTSVTGATSYGIQWRRENDDWTAPEIIYGLTADFTSAYPGTWVARVWSVNAAGLTSLPVHSSPQIVGQPAFPIIPITIGYEDPPVNSIAMISIDALVGEQFSLLLNDNIQTVQFENVPDEKIIILFIVQGGAFNITWPENVTFESGEPFVPTQAIGRVDTIGLSTKDQGITWLLKSSANVDILTGGTNSGEGDPEPPPAPPGTVITALSITANNLSASCDVVGVIPCVPSVVSDVVVSGGTAPYRVSWIRTAGSNLSQIDNATVVTPAFSLITGVDAVDDLSTWRITVVDANEALITRSIQVRLIRVTSNLAVSMSSSISGQCTVHAGGGCSPSAIADTVVTGGVPPYISQWSYRNGSAAIQPNNPTLAAPTFRVAIGRFGGDWTAVWAYKVTDATGSFREALLTIDLTREIDPIGIPP